VSATVNLAREHGVPFVVSAGRHSTGAASSIEGGIVIDLRKMRRVTVDAEKKTVTAEGGANWEDVDVEAAKHGLATVGGSRAKSVSDMIKLTGFRYR
jgi:FAD/FMN-containing dehydrogenase